MKDFIAENWDIVLAIFAAGGIVGIAVGWLTAGQW
jgi:hypothetical protein